MRWLLSLWLGLFANMGTTGDGFYLDLLFGMLTKAKFLEGLVLVCVNLLPPPLHPLPPTMKTIYMALDKHLDGEELWVVGYIQVVPGAEIWVGSHQGRATGGWEKGAEGRGQKA